MKKGITKILTVLFAVSLIPLAPLRAQGYTSYDYRIETPTIEWILEGINQGTIVFQTTAHKDNFLNLASELSWYRDQENWGTCVSKANLLGAAAEYIVTEHKSLVVDLIEATESIYNSDSEDFSCVDIDDTAVDEIRGALLTEDDGEVVIRICIEVGRTHLKECDYKGKKHQEEACAYRWWIRLV